jgi:predicted dehydrogenase
MEPLRIGILGAARIAPMALLRPARNVAEAQIVAVAARDKDRARSLASRFDITRVHDSYAKLIEDPNVDAIYNPLPNSLHAEWTVRALEAGKHVLCEKPLTANAAEAAYVAERAERTGKVVMEAFHYRYHPLFARALELLSSGAIGKVRHIETWVCVPMPMPGDIRYRLDLAGGAAMDTGCYAVHMLRHLAGADEPTVLNANALLKVPGIDRRLEGTFSFADGRTGAITCSLWSRTLLKLAFRVQGESGELSVFNPLAPQFYHHLTLRNEQGKKRERVERVASYECQLRAFVRAVREGTGNLTGPRDSVLNMRVIDALYTACGLGPRTGTALPTAEAQARRPVAQA